MPNPPLHVAAVVASLAVLALLITGLSLRVSQLRLRHRVSFGDGGHKALLMAVRAHGNALEQTTLYGVLALAGLALPAPPAPVLMGGAAVFTLARLVHAAALFGRQLAVRQVAHVASTLVHVVLALALAAAVWP